MADFDEGVVMDQDHTMANRSTYDRIASRYLSHRQRQEVGGESGFPGLEDAFLEGVPNGGLVADLGCGPASDAHRFVENGLSVIGLDLSVSMLSFAADVTTRLVHADIRHLPFADDKLDGIWCVAALLHVPEQDTNNVLREFRRTLKRSGHLALITALGDSSRFEPVPYAPEELRWLVYRSPDRLRDQVRRAGFRLITEGRVPGNRDWWTALALAV
jgi:ubiquinone/menaquinone biosynthesis C-methylase UbiE